MDIIFNLFRNLSILCSLLKRVWMTENFYYFKWQQSLNLSAFLHIFINQKENISFINAQINFIGISLSFVISMIWNKRERWQLQRNKMLYKARCGLKFGDLSYRFVIILMLMIISCLWNSATLAVVDLRWLVSQIYETRLSVF